MGKMPMLFVGHGTPMNAIEDNQYSNTWKRVLKGYVKPKAILSISAHWYTKGSYIQKVEEPKQVYDMYGFPMELYELKYPVSGLEELSDRVLELAEEVSVNNNWGIDHGSWSVLCHIYPEADIPVVQLSIDGDLSLKEHFELGKKLASLREEGILILGSGNILHNLRDVEWDRKDMTEKGKTFDDTIHDLIQGRDFSSILEIENNEIFKYAAPTPEHFIPLVYILANIDEDDEIEVFNRGGEMGSLSMTSYLIKKGEGRE